jgi:hypothetical protein
MPSLTASMTLGVFSFAIIFATVEAAWLDERSDFLVPSREEKDN